MAVAHQLSYPFRDLHCWDENECLDYYGLLSLHEVFEIVGSQLTETDIEVLSFLLNETCMVQHPLDPAGWTVEPSEDDPNDAGVLPSLQLLNLWRRLNASTSPQPLFAAHKPKSGLELLLELENRGYISEGNLEPLLQLLRVLTRHDLLPFVSHKRRRTVSPERFQHWRGAEHRELMFSSGLPQTCRATEMPLSFTQQGRSGLYSPVPVATAQKRRRKRGNGWSRKPKKTTKPSQPPPPPPPAPKSLSCVTHSDRIFGDRSRLGNSSKQSLCAYTGFHMLAHCFGPCRRAEGKIFVAAVDSRWFLSELLNIEEDLSRALAQDNVRLRVRAEYLEHESALRNGVASDKRQPLERQFELFSQANSVLRARNLGSIVCDIKFTELDNLQAFWADYLSGALLEALKGVFITDSLRSAAGSEGVRLLISVDQDDYEEGCRLLRAKKESHAEPGQGQRSHMRCTV